jgi:hypothetical protein
MLELRGGAVGDLDFTRMTSRLKHHCADALVAYANLSHVLA